MNRSSLRAAATILLVAVSLLAGCAATPTRSTADANKPYYYPALPNEPRLQFLTAFDSASSFVNQKSSFDDFLAGKKQGAVGNIKMPYGIDAHGGKLYVCDLGSARIHVIDLANKQYGTLGGKGQVLRPANITIDRDGTKYVSDTGKGKIVVFGPDDRFVTEFGKAGENAPIDLAILGDELFVADRRTNRVDVWSKKGENLRVLVPSGEGPDEVLTPTNVSVDGQGNIVITDTGNQAIKIFSPKGNYLRTIGKAGDRPGDFARPKGLAIDSHDNIYVCDAQWEVMQIFNQQGKLLGFFGNDATEKTKMSMPTGVAVDKSLLPYVQHLVASDFEAEYLLLITSQYGTNKVSLYAFGHRKGVNLAIDASATQPSK